MDFQTSRLIVICEDDYPKDLLSRMDGLPGTSRVVIRRVNNSYDQLRMLNLLLAYPCVKELYLLLDGKHLPANHYFIIAASRYWKLKRVVTQPNSEFVPSLLNWNCTTPHQVPNGWYGASWYIKDKPDFEYGFYMYKCKLFDFFEFM